MNKKALLLLGLGHLMVDLNTGALPALLPYLKNTFALSYTMTSMLVLVANVSSSLVQPVFGYLSDRSTKAWLCSLLGSLLRRVVWRVLAWCIPIRCFCCWS